jgi:hypothetical protein
MQGALQDRRVEQVEALQQEVRPRQDIADSHADAAKERRVSMPTQGRAEVL